MSWTKLIFVVLVAGVFLLGVDALPLADEEQRIIPVRGALESLILEPDMKIRQRVIAPAGTYSGVVLYSDAERMNGQQLLVTIFDIDGKKLAEGSYVSVTYRPDIGDLMRLEVQTKWITLVEPGHLFVEIQLTGGPGLPLRVSSESTNIYKYGELVVEGQKTEIDLALTLLSPVKAPFGVEQGVLVGVIVLISLALLQLIHLQKWRWIGVAVLVVAVTPLALSGYWFFCR